MKKANLLALAAIAVPLFAAEVALAAPTKEIVQPAQGMNVAQEACRKYAGDESKEIACVLFHAGAVKKVDGRYELNVQLVQPVEPGSGRIVKCKAEMVYLPDGSIGWKETNDCH